MLNMILKKIEETIDGGGYDITSLEREVNDCVNMLTEARDYFVNRVLSI